MDLQLAGKRALVTGASGAIGEAIAIGLAAERASVIVHGRRRDAVGRVVEAITASGGRAAAAVADLSNDGAVAGLAEEHSEIDILVNCAGSYANSTWWTATAAEWVARYDANVGSAVRLIRALVPPMQQRRFGRVIQISSGLATQPFPGMPDYAATKAALVNLTTSLARELTGSGVTVNTVSPGIVATPGVESFFSTEAETRGWGTSWPEIEAGVIRDVLPNSIGRLARVEEVADLITFLASPRAGAITGANYRIDGGSTTSIN